MQMSVEKAFQEAMEAGVTEVEGAMDRQVGNGAGRQGRGQGDYYLSGVQPSTDAGLAAEE